MELPSLLWIYHADQEVTMPDLIIQLIIVMLVCGFVYWCYLKLIPLAPIAEPFASVLNVLVVILIGAIVLFYAIIPLLHALGHMSIGHY